MSQILVTGGAGFLGSHLCDRLIANGNDVVCVDNYFTGSKENIRHLIGSRICLVKMHSSAKTHPGAMRPRGGA